jgi:fructose-1-phosphate kinase PfkB-like protein
MLAGAATSVARGGDANEWLRAAVAAGTAATQSEAGRLPSREVLRVLRKSVR